MKQKPKIFFEEARNELKRADHLMFVSLKYTRTVDVIRSLFERLVLSIEAAMTASLEAAVEEGKLYEVPDNIGLRRTTVLEIYDHDSMRALAEMHVFLKKVLKADYKRSNEFRRYVTMTVLLDSGMLNIDIDKAREYYDNVRGLIENGELFLNGGEAHEMQGRGL